MDGRHESALRGCFFFNDAATTEIYTLSLHDALPISRCRNRNTTVSESRVVTAAIWRSERSEEHTSELQSLTNLVCRLLLEKKKMNRLRAPVHIPNVPAKIEMLTSYACKIARFTLRIN